MNRKYFIMFDTCRWYPFDVVTSEQIILGDYFFNLSTSKEVLTSVHVTSTSSLVTYIWRFTDTTWYENLSTCR